MELTNYLMKLIMYHTEMKKKIQKKKIKFSKKIFLFKSSFLLRIMEYFHQFLSDQFSFFFICAFIDWCFDSVEKSVLFFWIPWCKIFEYLDTIVVFLEPTFTIQFIITLVDWNYVTLLVRHLEKWTEKVPKYFWTKIEWTHHFTIIYDKFGLGPIKSDYLR